MDHAVAVERVIAAERLMDLVFGVAQIDPVEIGGDFAFDHVELGDIDLFAQRRPCAVEIGMIVRQEGVFQRRQTFDLHGRVPCRLGP